MISMNTTIILYKTICELLYGRYNVFAVQFSNITMFKYNIIDQTINNNVENRKSRKLTYQIYISKYFTYVSLIFIHNC